MWPHFVVGDLGAAVAAAGASTPIELVGNTQYTITVTEDPGSAAINGTIKVQGSVLDKPDPLNADHWFDIASVAAKGHTFVTGKPSRWIRRNVTVYVAGTFSIAFTAV